MRARYAVFNVCMHVTRCLICACTVRGVKCVRARHAVFLYVRARHTVFIMCVQGTQCSMCACTARGVQWEVYYHVNFNELPGVRPLRDLKT